MYHKVGVKIIERNVSDFFKDGILPKVDKVKWWCTHYFSNFTSSTPGIGVLF
jgi:hypothetical protein